MSKLPSTYYCIRTCMGYRNWSGGFSRTSTRSTSVHSIDTILYLFRKNSTKYNNPIPPPQRPRNSKFMSGKSVISKGRIERTRDPNSVPSNNKTVKTSPIMKNNRKKKQF